MSYYDEIKKELENNAEAKTEFDAMEVPSVEEFWHENRSTLKTPKVQNRKKRPRNLFRFLSYAACIMVFFGVSLVLGLNYVLAPTDKPANNYKYEDTYITTRECTESDLKEVSNVFLPDIDMLTEITLLVGEHKESREFVYFSVFGVHDDGEHFRSVRLLVILQPKYQQLDEDRYNTDNIVNINGRSVSIYDKGYEEPFFCYKLGFKVGDFRYHIDYETINENDCVGFLTEFLK